MALGPPGSAWKWPLTHPDLELGVLTAHNGHTGVGCMAECLHLVSG